MAPNGPPKSKKHKSAKQATDVKSTDSAPGLKKAVVPNGPPEDYKYKTRVVLKGKATKKWTTSLRCEDVGRENGEKLAQKAQDEKLLVHRIYARHSPHKNAKRQPSNAFNGLRRVINLVVGCKVMICRNIAYKYGLANGTRGKLVGVVYSARAPVGTFPEALIVEVPEYKGPVFFPNEPK